MQMYDALARVAVRAESGAHTGHILHGKVPWKVENHKTDRNHESVIS